jgi:hypothetical protein
LPWSVLFAAVLALMVLVALVLVELDLVTFAYERLGLGHRVALGLLRARAGLAPLTGSGVD